MISKPKYIVACNGIKIVKREKGAKYLELEHDKKDKAKSNVKYELLDFVSSIYKLDDRKRDLLEIAGYIFAADRKSSRGEINSLEMHSWSREFEIHISVRDLEFWNQPKVKKMLDDALSFMTGDHKYEFYFNKADKDFKTNLFDTEKFIIKPSEKLNIVLFSGGLDSLSGIIELLETTDNDLCLMSHQSGNPSTANTQDNLFKEIDRLYPSRCTHYKYYCGLKRERSIDETQRTRSFLFNSIAFALATTFGINENILFENGVTSFNFAETQDMMNSRASRTTHPKTLGLLEKLFTEINAAEYKIENRYYNKTKTDVVKTFDRYNKLDLIDISVSCSVTMLARTSHTHCGICSQCIDRRFAMYSAEIEEQDECGLYGFDFVTDDLEYIVQKKALSDYIRMAKKFAELSLDGFYDEFIEEFIDIDEYLNGRTEKDNLNMVYDLCSRHGKQIEKALDRMRKIYDKSFTQFRPNSLFSLLLGMRSDNSFKLIRLDPKGELKKDVPERKLKEITAKVYQDLLNKGIIDINTEETKKNPDISKIVILELDKSYILKSSEKRTISDYFRQKRIEVNKMNKEKIEVVTYKN